MLYTHCTAEVCVLSLRDELSPKLISDQRLEGWWREWVVGKTHCTAEVCVLSLRDELSPKHISD